MNSIHVFYRKIKGILFLYREDIIIFIIVFLGTLCAWGIYMAYSTPTPRISISQLNISDIATTAVSHIQIVGNKNSKIYHLADCPGAKAMNEANKIFFDSIEAALAAGYRAAKNCPQLEYLVK